MVVCGVSLCKEHEVLCFKTMWAASFSGKKRTCLLMKDYWGIWHYLPSENYLFDHYLNPSS